MDNSKLFILLGLAGLVLILITRHGQLVAPPSEAPNTDDIVGESATAQSDVSPVWAANVPRFLYPMPVALMMPNVASSPTPGLVPGAAGGQDCGC